MRRAALPGLLVLAIAGSACGDDLLPVTPPPCTTTCTDACPGDLACVEGVCAVAGSSCQFGFEQVGAGNGFACARDQLGRAWCWGDNTHHQVDGSARPYVAHMQLRGPAQWDQLAVGGGHVCGLRDGALACWGRNDRGQARWGDEHDPIDPVPVEAADAPARWTAVSAGYRDTCAIGDGRLFCWGAGELGQLGSGLADDREPTEVLPPVRDWVAVSAGDLHTCAISSAQGLFCWGDNSSGELGDGTVLVRYQPTPVPLGDVVSVATGQRSTCAVTGDGQLFCWGHGQDGELGDPAHLDPDGGARFMPTSASALGGWTRVASAEHYQCGLRGDEVWCWGAARGGGLGGGAWSASRAWARVATGATDLAVGWNKVFIDSATDAGDLDLSCAVVHGAVSCWGDDRFAQLGNGGVTLQPAPAEIGGGHRWSAIAAGPEHVCGVDGGAVSCWGGDEQGQVDGIAHAPCAAGDLCAVATPRPRAPEVGATAVAAGRSHACALAAGAITCWGAGAPDHVEGAWSTILDPRQDGGCAIAGAETWCWGQVVATTAPAHQPSLDGATGLALGPGFGCALDASHALACFGDPAGFAFGNGEPGACGDGRCNHGESSSTCAADCGAGPLTPTGRIYAQITAGWTTRFACGVTPAGRVECWGANGAGQAGEPDPDSFVVDPVATPYAMVGIDHCTQVVAGAAHACALCAGSIDCWGDGRLGQLGPPLEGLPVLQPRRVDVPLAPDDHWAQLAAGATFTCARSEAGRGWCWGFAPRGGLGNGGVGAPAPVTVPR